LVSGRDRRRVLRRQRVRAKQQPSERLGGLRPSELGWRTNNWAAMEAAGAAFVEKRWYDRFHSEDQFNAGAAVGGTLQPGRKHPGGHPPAISARP